MSDIERPDELIAYLRRHGHLKTDERPEVVLLAGGVSNRTVLLRRAGGDWVLKQALPQLRVDVEWLADPARAEREALALAELADLAPAGAVPRLIFSDPAEHLLAMEAVPEPHENYKTLLLTGQVDERLVDEFARLLATIHRRASEPARAARLADVFADRSFFESLRLEPYYLYAASQAPAAAPFLNELVASTRQRRDTLVHGDYSPKNVLVRADRLVLLDFEVIHWGDAAFDLGFALAHFLSKMHHLPAHRTRFFAAAERFWGEYEAALGPVAWKAGLQGRACAHTLGCLLARVAGRSKLEYLSPEERRRQQSAVIALMKGRRESIAILAARFAELVDAGGPSPTPRP